MKNVVVAIVVSVSILFVLSCGLVEKFTGGGQKMNEVSQLWTDVPPMNGMTRSEVEMPMGTKLILRTVIGNLGLLNKNGESRATGDIDWTSFSGDQTPADIRAFYNNERMASFGNWDKNKSTACVDGKDKGLDGAFCVFQKHVEKRQVGLVIFAVQDEKTKMTNVYYLRIEADNPDTPVSVNK